MNLRAIKEGVLGAPAELLARLKVSPNVVTLVGLLLTLGAESVAVSERSVDTSNSESTENRTGVGIFWLATLARLLALLADGLDGSVARAHKKINPAYTNENGSYIDGATDRLVNTIRMMVESHRYEMSGKQGASVLASLTAVSGNLPSFLRAATEARGGVTTEQSLNFWEFAGTHVGRTAIYTLISLEHSQVDQIVSAVTFGNVHLLPETWEQIKIGLIAYVAIDTAMVSSKRAGALADTYQEKAVDEDSQQLQLDSAGFNDKKPEAHRKRAQLYALALAGSAAWAGIALARTVRRH